MITLFHLQDLAYPGFAIREIAARVNHGDGRIKVFDVSEQSIAAESRLQVGDVIEKVNDCSVKGKEKVRITAFCFDVSHPSRKYCRSFEMACRPMRA